MNVIFLDIDGVMNSHVFYERRHKRRLRSWNHIKYVIKKPLLKIGLIQPTTSDNYKPDKNRFTFEYQFKRLQEETCNEKWQWLSEWCNSTDTKICVSSTWKHHFGTRDYKSTPNLWEDAFQLLGFKPGTYVGITGDRKSIRGEEIKEWLDTNPQVENYAILDDDSDMLIEQFSRFHHCDYWFGMSPNHLYRIERQFSTKGNYEKLTETLK
jgi:hypothetical protein